MIYLLSHVTYFIPQEENSIFFLNSHYNPIIPKLKSNLLKIVKAVIFVNTDLLNTFG